MAEGIRIVPKPALAAVVDPSQTVCVTDLRRPTPEPKSYTRTIRDIYGNRSTQFVQPRLVDIKPRCKACGHQHFAKTYVIHLKDGAALVSTGVWASLCSMGDDNPFEYANPVPEPPGQIINPWADGVARPELVEKFVMPIQPPPPIP